MSLAFQRREKNETGALGSLLLITAAWGSVHQSQPQHDTEAKSASSPRAYSSWNKDRATSRTWPDLHWWQVTDCIHVYSCNLVFTVPPKSSKCSGADVTLVCEGDLREGKLVGGSRYEKTNIAAVCRTFTWVNVGGTDQMKTRLNQLVLQKPTERISKSQTFLLDSNVWVFCLKMHIYAFFMILTLYILYTVYIMSKSLILSIIFRIK